MTGVWKTPLELACSSSKALSKIQPPWQGVQFMMARSKGKIKFPLKPSFTVIALKCFFLLFSLLFYTFLR